MKSGRGHRASGSSSIVPFTEWHNISSSADTDPSLLVPLGPNEFKWRGRGEEGMCVCLCVCAYVSERKRERELKTKEESLCRTSRREKQWMVAMVETAEALAHGRKSSFKFFEINACLEKQVVNKVGLHTLACLSKKQRGGWCWLECTFNVRKLCGGLSFF